jgi:hypothetical protein
MGSNFGCFDIAGLTFSSSNTNIYVEVASANASLFI